METPNASDCHLYLVTDDLDHELSRLAGIGCELRRASPVGIRVRPHRGRGAYLHDLDGISVQLLEPPAGGPSLDCLR